MMACDGRSDSARLLWKRLPAAVKESNVEVQAVWRVLQALWNQDYKVHPLSLRSQSHRPTETSGHDHPHRAVLYRNNAQPSPDNPKRRV
jgi:hypothetical protein